MGDLVSRLNARAESWQTWIDDELPAEFGYSPENMRYHQALDREAAKEIVQLRKDVAIMRDNSSSVLELEAERADLAETLRVVRNTQGGRFGLDWPSVERMINEALSPARPDVPARRITCSRCDQKDGCIEAECRYATDC
jgi:hypothetical protein